MQLVSKMTIKLNEKEFKEAISDYLKKSGVDGEVFWVTRETRMRPTPLTLGKPQYEEYMDGVSVELV